VVEWAPIAKACLTRGCAALAAAFVFSYLGGVSGDMKDKLRRIILAAGNVYAVLVLLLLALQRTPLGSQWWLRLGGDFLPFWFLPLLVLAPGVFLVSRSRAARALICVPGLLFVLLYGDRFLHLPAAASSARPEPTLTVMTYNVTRGDPGREEILSIIDKQDADVVALQEVPPKVAEAVSGLSDRYPYQALHPTADGYAGCAVLSRFPISEDEVLFLVEGMHLSQRLVLDVEGKRVHLFNVHLQPPRLPGEVRLASLLLVPSYYDTTTQDRELARLLEELAGLEEPVLVVGDFNMTDQSEGYKRVTSELGDAFREVGWGFGHTYPDVEVRSVPTPFPLVRIDYIFHSREMTSLRAQVGDRGGPDHRYLVAELAL
jgi:vancomycin resistance protein VanJ